MKGFWPRTGRVSLESLSRSAGAAAKPTVPHVIPYQPTVGEHVDQLLNRLQAQGCCEGWVLARDLMRIHQEMICELNWAPKPWAPAVARALALRLQAGRKTYLDVVEEGGRRTRLRAYPMPSAAANPGSTIRETG